MTTKYVDCPFCEGEGIIHASYYPFAATMCGFCGGEGELTPEQAKDVRGQNYDLAPNVPDYQNTQEADY